MKSKKTNPKLNLTKKVVAKLQNSKMSKIMGGQATTTTGETYTCTTNTNNTTC